MYLIFILLEAHIPIRDFFSFWLTGPSLIIINASGANKESISFAFAFLLVVVFVELLKYDK